MRSALLRGLGPFFLVAVLLQPAAAQAALTVQGVRTTDVTPSAFAVVWKASGPASPEIAVYADAEGTTEITRTFEVTPLPLQGGDPASADDVQRVAAQERIRSAARALGQQKIAVQGCRPGITYHYRVTSRGPGGEVATWPAAGLAAVTTALETTFVPDARQLLVNVTDGGVAVDSTGWVVTAAGPGVLSPVSALGGDGCAANQAVLNLGRLFGSDGRSWAPAGGSTVEVEIVGAGGGRIRQSVGVGFPGGFQVASVTVLDVALDQANTAPVAADQAVGTDEDTALPIVLAATDADGDPLTYAVVTAPAHGSLSGGAPNLTYTPARDYNGSDSFTFRASDGIADSAPATVSITVTPVNDAPVAADQAVVTSEDASVAITLAATDVDGDPLTYAVATGPAHGVLSGAAPNLTYTPVTNSSGADSFTFRASDGVLESAAATVSVTVTPVNDPPVLRPVGNRAVAEGALLAFVVVADDPDGDPLTYGAIGLPTGASLDAGSGAFAWTPGFTQAGDHAVTFTASDGSLTDAVTVTITVTGTNRPPVIDPVGNRTVVEGATLSFTLSAADPDGDALTLSLLAAPPGASFDATSGAFTWRPRLDQAGSYVLTFRATDNGTPPARTDETVAVAVANPATAFFFDDFKDGAAARDWRVLSGSWSALKGVYTAGSLLKTNLVRVLPLDPVSYPLGAGVVQAQVKLAATASRVVPNGLIVFGYQSPTRYRWVRVASDGISIGQTGILDGVAAGMKKRLATAQPLGVFQQVTVKIHPDGWVRVYKGKSTTPVLSNRFLRGKAPSVVPGGVGLATSKAKTVFDNVTVWEDSRL